MINFPVQKLSGKWKTESQFGEAAAARVEDYFKHFHEALLNFEMNQQEERLRKRRKRTPA
ncbi:MAG: hypothetical protein P8X57_16595 [Cyclobacteriaceae bacterium]